MLFLIICICLLVLLECSKLLLLLLFSTRVLFLGSFHFVPISSLQLKFKLVAIHILYCLKKAMAKLFFWNKEFLSSPILYFLFFFFFSGKVSLESIPKKLCLYIFFFTLLLGSIIHASSTCMLNHLHILVKSTVCKCMFPTSLVFIHGLACKVMVLADFLWSNFCFVVSFLLSGRMSCSPFVYYSLPSLL